MSLWNRGIEKTKDMKKSDELVKKRDEHTKKWTGGLRKEWEEADQAVLKMAEQMSVAQYTQNPDRILEAKEDLKQAIWKRDGIREGFQRQCDELGAAIEVLSRPMIFSTAKEWSDDLVSLRNKKIVEQVSTRWDPEKGKKITFKSNFAAINRARETLSESIGKLRSMQWEGLSVVNEFIQKTETTLKAIDFAVLVEAEEVPEWKYHEIIASPEVTVYTTARLIPGFRLGQDRIEKNFDLPRKEDK
jgi:hypothetical protein